MSKYSYKEILRVLHIKFTPLENSDKIAKIIKGHKPEYIERLSQVLHQIAQGKQKDTRCSAKIYHGPGHQSSTRCHNTKKHHKIHEAYYGSCRQHARWKGQEVCSGFFDEPPQGDN